ncbi:MAG TPA: FtsK/SpoIIIE domain-containing protein, partial [Myxococcota bacterium]|nr:FtsK/SpoIIIE domain-containing protein [Myxococcota bacterium]
VIDEFADLMDVLGKRERDEFEQQVNRMAQRTRNVGIHLVIATQRPDVKVVTGRLKSNLNCRISFALPSAVDSKTILDFGGAERLLGKGDMLLKHEDKLTRLQGYYVSSAELDEVLAGSRDWADA